MQVLSSLLSPIAQNSAVSDKQTQNASSSAFEGIEEQSAKKIAAHNAAIERSKPAKPDPYADLAEYMSKDSMERLRDQILRELGVTEEQIAAMPPEEQRQMLDKIAMMLEEKIRTAAEKEQEKLAQPQLAEEPTFL